MQNQTNRMNMIDCARRVALIFMHEPFLGKGYSQP
jgi:hypothetical protein